MALYYITLRKQTFGFITHLLDLLHMMLSVIKDHLYLVSNMCFS